MLQHNFKKNNINAFSFTTNLILGEQDVENIANIATKDEDGDYVFYSLRKIDNKNHIGMFVLSESQNSSINFHLTAVFTDNTKNIGSVKNEPKVEQLLEIIPRSNIKSNFNCTTRFLFNRRQKVKPIISLPGRFINLSSQPFDEISGIRFVKKQHDDVDYDVIMEIAQKDGLVITVSFEIELKFDNTLAQKIINKAIDISNKFIIRD